MLKLAVLAAALILSGCSTAGHFTNEAYCSGERMVFVSWYYGVGIAAKVDNGREHCAKLADPVKTEEKP